MKEKFERFKNEKIVVNVRSQKQYDDFMKMCEEQGLQWNSGDLPTEINVYNRHQEDTCITVANFNSLFYLDIDFYKNNDYKIITYKDFLKEESKQFTKSNLKDNHIVVLRNNTKILYTKGTEDGFKKLIKHDLTHSYGAHLDIMEVWEFDKLVWKREEQILDEVEKRWLNHFIKSTNIKVNYITKYESVLYNNREYLEIDYNDSDDHKESIRFPYFEKGSMYKGLELNKKYTLEELG
ncbi:MAG TPA: hypothetical protein GX708_14695, partial [Gallicola sp.]|nr:hypothetical protein [Gallicola sp.]